MEQSDLISALTKSMSPKQEGRQIGAILVEAGKLTPADVEKILRLQWEKGLRFGEAAIKLRLLSPADIDFALARQFDYPLLTRGQSSVSEAVVAAYDPFNAKTEALRALRSQLMMRWFDHDPARRSLAVISAARREGRSFIAANLAVLFSQLSKRTVLIDADLRAPRLHEFFGLDNRVGLSAVLTGRAGSEAVQRVPALHDLLVLPAGVLPPNPQELLLRPAFSQLLDQLAAQVDVILLDSPAASETADAQVIAVRAGAALIVARKNATRMWRVQGISDSVAQARATIVGAVLNEY
jgi:protein-tyrosine kinase